MMPEKPFDVSAAARNLREKHLEENRKLEKRRILGQDLAARTARLMAASDDSLVRIIGFGSTFEIWRNYRFDSDIDLAVTGGSLKKLESVIPRSTFEISIIQLEDQSPEFQQLVLKNGTVLYEK